MITWKESPLNPLIAEYVEAYWFIHKTEDDDSNPFPKLYPDVSAHLVIAIADYQCTYKTNQSIQIANGCHCILPHSQTFIMDHSKAFTILGVKIRPGRHKIFSALITQNDLNTIAPSNQLWIGDTDMPPWLVPNYPVENTVRELDNWLIQFIDEDSQPKHQDLIRQAIHLLPDHSCSDLSQKLGTSQRTLERHFQQQTLMTLKQFQSAIRAEKLLEYLYAQDPIQPDWAEISAQFGFSDQPHLIRELKHIIGATPGTYWQEKDLTIDVYGDFHASSHNNKL